MKFSLILATVGRVQELERFLSALASQVYQQFELFVVDQNPDNRLDTLLTSFEDRFQIIHLRSRPGLSRARNAALSRVTGDIVAFPDDDCWYPTDLLERVATICSQHPEWDGVTGRPAGPAGAPWPGWARANELLTRRNILYTGISFTIFLRRRVLEAVGNFDETIGAGAGTPWNWGEETDYLCRALEMGFRIYDRDDFTVLHREPPNVVNPLARAKDYSQALGMGYFLRKHRFPALPVSYNLLRPLAACLYCFGSGRTARAVRYWTVFRGRLRGYCSASWSLLNNLV